jgi:hypothetical protein
MGASITLAGESLNAQKQAAQEILVVERFIFANVPGLDHSTPVDRAAAKPAPAQIVYSAEIPAENAGFVNPNQVVYSVQAGSDVGDWDFNWIGLETAEGVLYAVAYVPLQQKRRNIPPLQIGNNLTRNFLLAFDGAQALTGITIDASTWQHDFTIRLAGIDERERQSNRDIFGRACFFGSALQLEKVGAVYQLKTGTAYVEGVRLQRSAVLPVVPPAFPTTAWLDVALQRELNDVVASWSVVWGAGKVDYVDSAGVQHYCVAIADLPNSNTITDSRPVENIAGPLVAHFAARVGDYAGLRARSTTKDDVGLGNLPNAKSDDENTDSSVILATTKAVKAATALTWTAIANIVSGATTVGKAAKLATPRLIALSGDATGSASFDGSGNADISVTANENTLYRRNLVTDGACRSAQLTAKSLSTTAQYGAVDMFEAWAGGVVSAGIIRAGLAGVGQLGTSLLLAGVTLTGAGAVFSRHRIEAANARELKDKTASLSVLVLHDVGAAVNYTLTLRKANAADNFTAVTHIAASAAISVPSGVPTRLRLEAVAMGDCANGIEIEVTASCGAVTGRNFHFTEWQLEQGTKATRFAVEPIVATLQAVDRYLVKSYEPATLPGTVTMAGASVGDSSGINDLTIPFRVRMRVPPTVTYYSALTGNAGVASYKNTQLTTPQGDTAIVFSLSSTNCIQVETYPGDAYMPIIHFVADARL